MSYRGHILKNPKIAPDDAKKRMSGLKNSLLSPMLITSRLLVFDVVQNRLLHLTASFQRNLTVIERVTNVFQIRGLENDL